MGNKENGYPLKFGLITVNEFNERMEKEKSKDKHGRLYPWYRNGVSNILNYEIIKQFYHIYINGNLSTRAIQNIPNQFYPAIISVEKAKVEIVDGFGNFEK